MASITKTPKGDYRVQISVKPRGAIKAIRESETLPTLKEAKAWAAERERILRNYHTTGRHTLFDAIDRYMREVSPSKRSEFWEFKRVSALKADPDFPGVFPLSQLTDRHFNNWRDARLKKVKPGTVLRDFSFLGSVLEYARRDWKWINNNPIRDVRKPKSPPHRKRLVSMSEQRAMLRALGVRLWIPPVNQSQATGFAALLALHTGMRSGEICDLTWGNVHEKHLHLPRTKNGQSRDVPLDRTARRIIATMRGFDDDLVFGVSSPLRDALWRKARAKAKLKGFTFHDLRHNAATRIGQGVGKPGGLSFPQFCVMFGWSDPANAMIYTNPSASDMADLL